MTVIAIPPGFDFVQTEWSLDVPAQVNRSDWTGRRKVVGLPGAERWFVAATVEGIATEQAERAWRAFTVAMRGVINVCHVEAACQRHIGPMPTVGAGATNGRTMPLTGLSPRTTILEAGQYLTVPLPSGHNRLVLLTADLLSDANGNAVAVFGPSLTEVPAPGQVVETVRPFCPVNFAASRQGWKTENGLTVFQIDAEEAL